MTTVRAAVIQAHANMPKDEAIDKHVELIAKAAADGAEVTCLQEIFHGPYFCAEQAQVVRDGGAGRRPHGHEDARAREAARHGPDRAVLRGGADRRVLQQRGRDRRRRHGRRQVSQDAHPARRALLLGEVLLQARQPRVPGVRHLGRQTRPDHLLRPPLPGDRSRARPEGRGARLQPVGDRRVALEVSVGSWSSRRTRSRTAGSRRSTGSGPRSRSRARGSTAPRFCDPRGQIVAKASDSEDEVLVHDVDLDKNREVRDTWQFLRDRRPRLYGELTQLLP